MSQGHLPGTDSTVLQWPLRFVTALAVRFPVTTTLASALLAVGCIVWSQFGLSVRNSRNDLLNPKSAYNRCWQEYAAEFGEQDDVIVVVQVKEPHSSPAENLKILAPVLDELAAQLNREAKFFRSVFHRVDPSRLQSKGLYYLDRKALEQIEGFLGQAQPVLDGNWAALNVGGQLGWFLRQFQDGNPQQLLANVGNIAARQAQSLEILATALTQSDHYQSPFPDMAEVAKTQQEIPGDGYFLTDGQRCGILTFWPVKDEHSGGVTEFSGSIGRLRHIVADVKTRHPEAAIGLTGLPIMEIDEMEASQWAMMYAGALSFVGVGLLYIAGFGCVRHPLLALVALFVPMAWSLGFIIVAVGHLNILSSAFATIVIGLGSDYGVYHIAQYLRYRGENMPLGEALFATARRVGPGLTTSAFATALAFFSIGLSDFPGIAELGIIAGGGLLLCYIASLTTLPAMIAWSDARRPPWKAPAPLNVSAWLRPIVAFPKIAVAVYLAATITLACGIRYLWYDNNLLNLQADGLECVELEKQLLSKDGFSTSFAVCSARSARS